jgi:hypothetical protein
MTPDKFRRIALGMKTAIEGAHMGHPDFRANGRIFATIHPGNQRGMVKLTPDQQQQFVSEYPSVFEPENGAWGREGCTRVHFAAADEDTVGEAMTLAWQNAFAEKPPAAKRTAKKAATRKRPGKVQLP